MMTNMTISGGHKAFWRIATLFVICTSAIPLFAQKDEEACLANSAVAVQRVLSDSDGLPKMILDKGYCVIVFPGVKKEANFPGSSYGKGALVCRKGAEMDNTWSAPVMYALDMTSLEFQVGSTETDFVLVTMSRKGADQLLNGKVKLGSNVTSVKGPTGDRAASYYSVERNADILIYSRLRAPFSGVSLKRASMGIDRGANKAVYGDFKDSKDLIENSQGIIPAAKELVDLLDKTSPMRK